MIQTLIFHGIVPFLTYLVDHKENFFTYNNDIVITVEIKPKKQNGYLKTMDTLNVRLLRDINNYRAKFGLSPLVWSYDLQNLSQRYAETLNRENFFSHVDKNGDHVRHRAAKMGLPKRRYAENLLMGNPKLDKNEIYHRSTSPKHNELMLRSGIVYVGFGESGRFAVATFSK